jgi:hypothetical protein
MRVWKYHIAIQGDPVVIPLPLGARPLSLQMQQGLPCVWVKVDPTMPLVDRSFQWIGTGHDFDQEATIDYVGTLQVSDAFVFHLFEVH